MYKNEKFAYVEYDYTKNYIYFENYVDRPVMLPFGIKKEVTLNDLKDFFQSRCFPKERPSCKQMLRALGVPFYEPELIVRKTHGLQYEDYLWLRFDDEVINYDDIKIRKD
jgi:hypothetical protein